MEQRWSPYPDGQSDDRQARYGSNPLNSPRQQQDRNGSAVRYDAFASPILPSQPASTTPNTFVPQSSRQLQADVEGDLPMEDADPFNKQKYEYPIRANQRSRPTSQYLVQEESSAARRYSPMNLSPTTPSSTTHSSGPQNHFTSYTPTSQSSRQSPIRPQIYGGSQSYQSLSPSRTQQAQLPALQSNLSPDAGFHPPRSATLQLNAVFGREGPPANTQTQQSPLPKGQVPRLTKCRSVSELRPSVNSQPPFRRANPEGGFISPLQALTTHLPATYRICNPGFKYESSRNPRRVLTKPSKGCKNDGYDNEDSDYILYVNDILGSEETGHKNRYLILDVLGQGTFGQVVKCQNLKTQEVVAVKVIKNRTAYFNQSMMEVSVLDLVNSKLDKNDDHHLLRLKDTFIHRQHLCLVFELLSVNLYELIKQNQFRGLSTTLVRVFAQQLLNGLSLLNKARIIHCDLKPENILLKNLESPIIKIIDFGSACDERQTVYTYIQSRFYRSPEVLLGLPYSAAIDMWSLGCILVELFLGLPLFPGSSEYNQVSRINEMLGQPPTWMLEVGKQSGEFFEKTHDEFGRRSYRLKSMEQYAREHNTKEQPSKKYFTATTLTDVIKTYPFPRKNMKQVEIDREIANRNSFIDFVRGLLCLNPLERWSPQQAKLHPFITQQKFTGPFVPPMNLKASSIAKSPAPGLQQQQQAEASSKQRAQAQQAAQMQAQNASALAAIQMNQYQQAPPQVQVQGPGMYGNMYPTSPQGAPPAYPASAAPYGQQMPLLQPPQTQMPAGHYAQQPNMYAQSVRGGRPRASTMDQQQACIPQSLQRVINHLDPNAPIRLQPSPAYYPPPPDGGADLTPGSGARRSSRAGGRNNAGRGNRDFIRTLEDRSTEDGYMTGTQPWH